MRCAPGAVGDGAAAAAHDGVEKIEVAEGSGPVDALMMALLKALTPSFPSLAGVQLLDYKVCRQPTAASRAASRAACASRAASRVPRRHLCARERVWLPCRAAVAKSRLL